MNGYQKYKEKSIYSMSGPELLQLLFSEADRRLAKADYALDDKDYELFEASIGRTSEIVRYLTHILDLDQPISRDLRRIYNYLVYDLSRVKAGRERNRGEIPRIRHILSELGDAFEQASREVKDLHITKPTGILG